MVIVKSATRIEIFSIWIVVVSNCFLYLCTETKNRCFVQTDGKDKDFN